MDETVSELVTKPRKIKTDPDRETKTDLESGHHPPLIKRRQVQADLEKVRVFVANLAEKNETRLPPERELAEAVGLTRARLRGALKKLVDEEMIWREVGSGTYVGQRPLIGTGNNTAEIWELTNPGEVMEARLLLEPELARLAAFRARGENILELQTCMQKMSAAGSRNDWHHWDRRFHRAIGRAANNTLLLVLLETVQRNMDRGIWGELSEKLDRTSGTEGSMQDHLSIFNPIKSRNPEAAFDAMRKHLLRVQRIYFDK